ncbi:MAG: hypothetical protein H6667_21825 [Ardenticatenaceae bacterium]|nr:hypothetical protein [Ardenticatenaceae bacterium]
MKKKLFLLSILVAFVGVWGVLALLDVNTAVAAPGMQEPIFPDQRLSVTQAVNWLITVHQNEDGGFSSFSGGANLAPSDVGGTLDAMLAISSGGYQPVNALAYLQANPADVLAYAQTDGSTAGKLVLALVAAGQNPRDFAGEDFVAALVNHLTENSNALPPYGQSLAILALTAVNEPISDSAIAWLTSLQSSQEGLDGSWDDGFGTMGNADATAMAIMALLSAGVPADDAVVARAVDWLTQAQLESGGWEYGPGFGQSVNSTALVVQALSALGLDFYSVDGSYSPGGLSPLQALLLAQGESGAFQANFGDGPFDDFFTSVQAIPAVAGKAFPLHGRYEAMQQGLNCLLTLQDPATGGWEQFAGFGIDAAGTSRAIQAIAAAGGDAASALPALVALAPDFLAFSRGGGIGIVMQGVVAAGGDVHDFAGQDLVTQMTTVLSPTGEYDSTQFGPFSHSEAMLGLLAAGEMPDETAVTLLLNVQTDGDWGGADSNGIAVNVLGRLGQVPPEAIANLQVTQLPDGGWGFDVSNPNSSSEVVQGLKAAGENPYGPEWSQIVSGTLTSAVDVVLAQQGENGCWPNLYGPGDDPYGTTDAILLLAQEPGTAVPIPVLISAPILEPDAPAAEEPAEMATEEPTAVPVEEPTAVPEPTDVPATPIPQPTEAPATATAPAAAAALVATTTAGASSTAPLILVIITLLLVVGGAYWYLKK